MKVTGWPGLIRPISASLTEDPDLHPGQVLGDQKEAGGVEAGDDGLADVDPPVDDDPFDRRDDGAVTQVLQGPLQDGFGLGHGALRLDYGGFAYTQIGLGNLIGRAAAASKSVCDRASEGPSFWPGAQSFSV